MSTVADARTVSEPIARLRADVMARKGSFVGGENPLARAVALWRAMADGRSRVQVRAAYLHELVALAKIEIGADWRLAGEHLPTARMKLLAPDVSDEDHAGWLRELGVADADREKPAAAVRDWTKVRYLYGAGEKTPQHATGHGGRWEDTDSRTVFWASGWMENHSIRDYAKVLRIGFRGIREEIEQYLAETDVSEPDFPRKENSWRAGLLICDAGILVGRRYADLAADMAQAAQSPEVAARLQRMAETCARVPAEGAGSFFEAVQALWFAHILTCGEDGINANSLGRLDQILYPYYQADVEKGVLTRAQAVELMEELACKLYLDYDVQAITLGGVDAEGRDAVNDLSYVILEATGNVGFVRDLSVRLHRDSPAAFVDLAGELIARGGGIPFLFNDDCFIPALAERGISLEDARDYAPIGCVELTIPGRANPHAVSGWFNSTKCLELALFDGVDPDTGERLGPSTGGLADFASFDELWAAYCRQVDCFAKRMVYECNRGELAQRERGPLPCWSVLTDACIPRGRDITDGGALYNYHSICFLGTANTADSLLALKKVMFDDGKVRADELLDALRCNFEGHELLRQLLLTQVPKYGNDCAEVDALARQVSEHFIDLMDRMRSPLDGRYFVHLFSFYCNIIFGRAVGATPDGRLAAEPLAYSLSAQQGRDITGLTAMLNSLARLPHGKAAGGSAAIIEVNPDFVQGDAGVGRLAQLIRGAIDMGVGQIQWNVTTVERLRKAQEDPERYGNIAVRVAGYSQMFKLIDKELQEHIIARTKHRF